MPTPIEARRLSGIDIGKTIEGTANNGRAFAATLTGVDHTLHHVVLWSNSHQPGFADLHTMKPTDTVMITGKPSPTIGPDCQVDIHRACDSRALDVATDEITRCQCTCHN